MADMVSASAAANNKKRVTVLFSGRGTNMASLIKAGMAKDYPALVTRAITNVPDAKGRGVAERHDIPCDIVDHREFETREAHEAAMLEKVLESRPDFVCLAGYMRILTESFVRRFRGRILNIHPSLLPSFKGVDTHHRALLEGVRIHGATVHFVDEQVDGGQIIAQAAVPVLTDDTDDTLADRVLEVEHQLYPHALELVASSTVRLSGSRVVVGAKKLPPHESPLFSPGLFSSDAATDAKNDGK